MSEIRQFKLSSNEEIICEVVEWPEEEDPTDAIVIRNAYKIVSMEQTTTGHRYHSLRPWMLFQENPETFQVLNAGHILGEAKPTTKVVEYYIEAIKLENEPEEESAKRLEDYIEKLRASIDGKLEELNQDSNEENIIKFPPRTIH